MRYFAILEEWSRRLSPLMLGLLLVGAYVVSVLPYLLLPPEAPTRSYHINGKKVSREVFKNDLRSRIPVNKSTQQMRRQLAQSDRDLHALQNSVLRRAKFYLILHAFWFVLALSCALIAARSTRVRFGHSPIRPILMGIVVGFVVGGGTMGIYLALAPRLQMQDFPSTVATEILPFLCLGASFALFVCWRKKCLVGHCAKCGYVLRGLPTPVCPECGTGFDPVAVARHYEETADGDK